MENELKRLTLKLEGDARKDAPILVEIERVITWLEMFNTLLKGLIKMNHVVEKSARCHHKVKLLMEHQQKQEEQQRRIDSKKPSSSSSIPVRKEDTHSKTTQVDLARSSTFTAIPRPVDVPSKRSTCSAPETNRSRHTSERSVASSSSSSYYSSNSSHEKAREASHGTSQGSSYTRQDIEDSLAARVAAILHRTAILDEMDHRQQRKQSREQSVPSKSKSCQDFRPKARQEQPKDLSMNQPKPSKKTYPKSYSADSAVDGLDSRRQTRSNSRQGDAWFVTMGSSGGDMNLQEAFERNRVAVKERIRQRSENLHAKVQKRKDLIDLLFKTKKHPYMCPPVDEQDLKKRKTSVLPTDKTIKMRRVFTHKQMRSQTERIYTKLPEVKEKQEEKDMQDFKKTHQIMKAVYTKRVKGETLKGKVDFPITQNFLVC